MRPACPALLVCGHSLSSPSVLPPVRFAFVLFCIAWRRDGNETALRITRRARATPTLSTATIITDYLQAARLPLSTALATALFYGIKSDTLGLMRGASAADVAAYLAFQSQIDRAALLAIEQAPVPVRSFQQLNAAMQAAKVYDDVVIADLGPMAYPDLVAELADVLLHLERVQWSVCLGLYEQQLIISVRTRDTQGGAGQLIQAVVGSMGSAGGHGMLAGGQVPVGQDGASSMAQTITSRVLTHLGTSGAAAQALVGAQPGATR